MIGKRHRKYTRPTNLKNQNNNARATPITPMAGAIVTAAILFSGLSLIGSYPQQPVLAQQEGMTGTTGGGATTGGGGGGMTGGGDTNTTTMGGGGAAEGGNATMTGGGAGGNDSMSQVRLHLEEARIALQNNDTQGALMHLDLALNALGNGNASGISTNITTATNANAGDFSPTIASEDIALSASEASSTNDEDDSDGSDSNTGDEDRTERDTDDEDSECGAVNIGGTGPADDYGCPPDDDGA